ncbi:MAG: addiction module toxin RelE [Spirochaetes bacterium]|nr:MAG: addiction module toxin RelE [Spirochaetota bacterium]
MGCIEFYRVSCFERKWKKLGYTEEHYEELLDYLETNPGAGNLIRGTGGAIKLRWKALDGKGKRGGARIIFFARNKFQQVFFISIYVKAKQTSLSMLERKELRKIIKQL